MIHVVVMKPSRRNPERRELVFYIDTGNRAYTKLREGLRSIYSVRSLFSDLKDGMVSDGYRVFEGCYGRKKIAVFYKDTDIDVNALARRISEIV